MEGVNGKHIPENHNITKEDVKVILANYGYINNDHNIENYSLHNASSKMLGFLSDYWTLQVIVTNNKKTTALSFFIKVISRTNVAKANMIREMKVFEKEVKFYTIVKNCIHIPGLKPWSAKLVAVLNNDAMVFEDLNVLQYKLRNKFERFDTAHTLQALRTLARFHASSIIYEENRSKELQKPYRINDECEKFLDEGGYKMSDAWFRQCMSGALEAVKKYSMHAKNKEVLSRIENHWSSIWSSALRLSDFSSKHRNVICHRDLWNNNILFHYKERNSSEPDDCVLVDFQAVRYQPPAGDVMLLLYCNLDPQFREQNMEMFLSYYYHELGIILNSYGVDIENVLPRDEFLTTTQEQRLWGLVVCACLIPQFWLDDDLTTKIFSDTAQFEEILSNDKASFITKMMEANSDYKDKVINIFEEIVAKYCLK